jgi:hypothetical protein
VAGHQPRPRRLVPWEPPAGSLHPPALREPPAGPLRAPATLTTLRPSADVPHHSKPQERPPIGVGKLKWPANKNNDKLYQMK